MTATDPDVDIADTALRAEIDAEARLVIDGVARLRAMA